MRNEERREGGEKREGRREGGEERGRGWGGRRAAGGDGGVSLYIQLYFVASKPMFGKRLFKALDILFL